MDRDRELCTKAALRREILWILRRIPRASKLLICGLFQKGRVLAQDGVRDLACWTYGMGKTCQTAMCHRVSFFEAMNV